MSSDLPWTMTGTIVDTRKPHDRPEFVCYACCENARITVNEVEYCITDCPAHPSIMIRDGKVVGDVGMSEKLHIPEPEPATSYDAGGHAYLVFRFSMPDGSYLDIDRKIAMEAKNTKAFLAAEYVRNLLGIGGHY